MDERDNVMSWKLSRQWQDVWYFISSVVIGVSLVDDGFFFV